MLRSVHIDYIPALQPTKVKRDPDATEAPKVVGSQAHAKKARGRTVKLAAPVKSGSVSSVQNQLEEQMPPPPASDPVQFQFTAGEWPL